MSMKSLTQDEAREAMRSMLAPDRDPEKVGEFLRALTARGETIEEIVGFLEEMRARAIPVKLDLPRLMDCCGTGGDGAKTFNISTASAIVLAAGAVPVAKHGNRSVSSQSGSADVLEALGVRTDLSPVEAAESIRRDGFAFLFAPKFHPALASLAPIRKALGIRTIFNFLGPLANPARLKRQLIGISDGRLLEKYAQVLSRQEGLEEALVVCSEDGMDEFSLSAPARIAHYKGGRVTLSVLKPRDFGVNEAPREVLAGGLSAENAGIIEKIISGETGPRADVVAMNAGASFWVAGLAASPREGADLARQVLASGKAGALLEKLRGKR